MIWKNNSQIWLLIRITDCPLQPHELIISGEKKESLEMHTDIFCVALKSTF